MNFLDLFRKKRYKYVKPCPRCGSFHTGYKIFINSKEKIPNLLTERTRLGERVEVDVGFNNDLNCFCDNCGVEWYDDIVTKYLTLDEIEEQKKLRGINEEYMYERDLSPKALKAKKKIKVKEAKKEKKEITTKSKEENKKNIKIKK